MSGEALGSKSEAMAAGAEYATERVGDLAKQGQRIAQDVDKQLEDYTGRSSEAWLTEGTRLLKTHPWKVIAATAVVAYIVSKLRA